MGGEEHLDAAAAWGRDSCAAALLLAARLMPADKCGGENEGDVRMRCFFFGAYGVAGIGQGKVEGGNKDDTNKTAR